MTLLSEDESELAESYVQALEAERDGKTTRERPWATRCETAFEMTKDQSSQWLKKIRASLDHSEANNRNIRKKRIHNQPR